MSTLLAIMFGVGIKLGFNLNFAPAAGGGSTGQPVGLLLAITQA